MLPVRVGGILLRRWSQGEADASSRQIIYEMIEAQDVCNRIKK